MKILSVRTFAELKAVYDNTVENYNAQLKEWLIDHGEALTGIDHRMWTDDNQEFLEEPSSTESIPLHLEHSQNISPRNLN